ncbi:replication-relaxation family protein [Amycolatopsis sp. NBC_01286]|uniref:replication-relaxation family protein n=1 Tax=Amycolatopsis sp. NBC_01286 TaxID=2903560 RepID=UPI002E0E7F0E|nr:replication-relaxation family protein [Amycolatopsis sp. NBC_01286]
MSGRGRARLVAERLSPRDWEILKSLRQLQLLTGHQLQRLHFAVGRPDTQARKTRAALQRLFTLELVVRLRRRIGGLRTGSAGYLYGLSGLGAAVLDLGQAPSQRHRRAYEAQTAFQDHTLAVAETYVQLVERTRAGRAELLDFTFEPRCWRTFYGVGGALTTLKPDGYARVGIGGWEYSTFLEIDLNSESAPTIRRKLEAYVRYWNSGAEQRQYGVFPRVWWFVPDGTRAAVITREIHKLLKEARVLFRVGLLHEAADVLTQPTEGGAR